MRPPALRLACFALVLAGCVGSAAGTEVLPVVERDVSPAERAHAIAATLVADQQRSPAEQRARPLDDARAIRALEPRLRACFAEQAPIESPYGAIATIVIVVSVDAGGAASPRLDSKRSTADRLSSESVACALSAVREQQWPLGAHEIDVPLRVVGGR